MPTVPSFQALIIGVGTYEHFSSLPGTFTDGKTLASILSDPLRGAYTAGQVQWLGETTATRQGILDGLAWLAEHADPNGTTLVYFSGHGGYIEGHERASACLCPREADLQNIPETTISTQTLSDALAAIKSARLAVILDACYAGGAANLKSAQPTEQLAQWKGGVPQGIVEKLSQGEGRVVMASSRADQVSWMSTDASMSLFTRYIINGIKGRAAVRNDGLVRILDLFHYISDAMHHDHTRQQPTLAIKDMTLNFPIAYYRGGRILQKGGGSADDDSPLMYIRQQLQSSREYIDGVQAIIAYIAALPPTTKRQLDVDVDELREQMNRIKDNERKIRSFGENTNWTSERSQLRFNFLALITHIERLNDGDDLTAEGV